MPKKTRTAFVPLERITHSILVIRGQKALLDSSLADLYGVTTGALVQAVKRNRERFPADFMLQLTRKEWEFLRSQNVISSERHGGRRYLPYAFTEQGVAMLSSVLRSKEAIAVNVQIMRAFVRLRELIHSNRELARQFKALELRLQTQLDTHDETIGAILSAIKLLMKGGHLPKRRPIGFTADIEGTS